MPAQIKLLNYMKENTVLCDFLHRIFNAVLCVEGEEVCIELEHQQFWNDHYCNLETF